MNANTTTAGTAVNMGENATEESWAEFYAYAN